MKCQNVKEAYIVYLLSYERRLKHITIYLLITRRRFKRSLHRRRIEPDETRRLIEKYEHVFPVTVSTYFMEYIRSKRKL